MKRGPLLLTMLVLFGLVYGSLYPFTFHMGRDETGALAHFFSTWNQLPQSRGDFLANLVLYVPFGFLSARLLAARKSAVRAASLALAAGAALSASMELLQFYDAGRVSCMSDFYLNSAGTVLGAVSGLAWGNQLTSFELIPKGTSLFAALLLLAWAAWRLYPYEPVIDLHKYWASVKPILLTPSLGVYDVARYAAMWSAVVYLARYGLKLRFPQATIPIAMAGVFTAKILIVDQTITLPELCGAFIALLYLNFVLGPKINAGTKILAALFVLSIVLERLLPFEISGAEKRFEWIPFFGFLHGSLSVDVQSFLQKCFLYGSGLYLLIDAGMALSLAAALESGLVLVTSLVETRLVGRSGEISDALMVLLLAVVYFLLESRTRLHRATDGPRASNI